jgi:hypothetical protein
MDVIETFEAVFLGKTVFDAMNEDNSRWSDPLATFIYVACELNIARSQDSVRPATHRSHSTTRRAFDSRCSIRRMRSQQISPVLGQKPLSKPGHCQSHHCRHGPCVQL